MCNLIQVSNIQNQNQMPQLYLIRIYINVPDIILYKRYKCYDPCLFVEFFNKKNP